MKYTNLVWIIIGIMWLPITAHTDTIYSWKGKDGSLRFSNDPPPEGVTEYQMKASEITWANDQDPENKRRASYDAMVQKASIEADRSRKERQEREAALAAEKRRIAEEKRKLRIQTERKRLEQQIEVINNRAVSPTMPYGMKQAQIEALTKKIEKLENGGAATGTPNDKSGKNTEAFSNKY